MKSELLEENFKKVVNSIISVYRKEFHEFLMNNCDDEIDGNEIIRMMMNIQAAFCEHFYYSIKELFNENVDYKIITVKLANHLSDCCEMVKKQSIHPVIPLSKEQVEEIQSVGYTTIKLDDGCEKKITEKDIVVKKEYVKEIKQKISNEIMKDNSKKIIVLNKGKIR